MRVLFRALHFAAATIGWHGLFMLGRPFMRNRTRWRTWIMRRWGRSMCVALGMRTHIEGSAPEAPFVLVSNHLSYVDIALIASVTGCVFVAKHQVASWPLLGKLCANLGTIFLKRDGGWTDLPRVGEAIAKHVAEGESVVFFPEGTSTAGASVAPFHPPLFDVLARQGIPVHHAALSYATPAGSPPAHLSVCWWGEMEFLEHLRALFAISSFDATLRFGASPIRDSNRKMLARRLHAEVEARFTPMVNTTTLARDCAMLETTWKIRAQNISGRTSMS
jgi:1-acyl-sn-glycerol-3-phosphate acyltransferase